MNKDRVKPELVCPAGDWSSLKTAVDAGADSVYFGLKGINMRANAGNFEISELKKVMDYLHERGCKGFLALNVIVMNSELPKVRCILEAAVAAGVDAVILWDMGVQRIASELGLNIHISTQASISNSSALAYYAGIGARRAVLARECTMAQIGEIVKDIDREKIPAEIEVFVHGAMCVSVSGRCFLSLESFGKSANRGECLQPCRREFNIKDIDDESEYIVGKDYLLSPKDLCTIGFIDQLLDTGVHSLKIEGRMRSKEYIRVVVGSYRQAIDAWYEGTLTEDLRNYLAEEVDKVYSRGFSTGFYFGQPVDWISRKLEQKYEKLYLGEIRKYYRKIQVAEVVIRSNEVKPGDKLFVAGKNSAGRFTVAEEIQQEHKFIDKAVKGEVVAIKIPFLVRPKDQVFLWREKPKR